MNDKSLQPAKLREFFSGGTRLHYNKSQIIIRPEDEPSGVFYIDDGFVKTYSINKNGSENLHLIRKSGETFPFIWAFTQEHREVYYEAVSDSALYRVARSSFLKFMDADPIAMKTVLYQAVEMYRVHSERLYNLQFQTAEERVIYRLLTLLRRFGTGDGPIKISVPLRHSDVAASLKMSRETATRAMSKLEKKGLIGYEKPYIVILKPEELKKLL